MKTKKKVYLIIDWTNHVEEVFLTKVKAQGWLARFKNDLPKTADYNYQHKYRIVEYRIVEKEII